ncbi:MAG: amidase [Clostridia bacterium]|nr:amidase [Clostridia bacterium]
MSKKYTEAPIDILEMSILEIQNAVDLGLIDYETIARIYLERIEEYNDEFKAVISVNENIVEQAKKCDEEYAKNGRKSELFGIPIILKDNIDYVGLPTTAGAKGLADNYPKTNAKITQNLVDVGALIIGKANMSEFAFSAAISKSSYGTVKNAYNKAYTTYGSSGGTAVAVSTGMAVAGVGTDTNSSIRVPSSAANLFGLRPTYGLLSGDGIIKYDASRDTAGPMTKYAEDNEIMLDAMSNNDKEYTKNEIDVSTLKVGVLTQFVNGDSKINLPAVSSTSTVVLDLFNKKIDELEELGIEVVEIKDFYSYTVYNYYYNTIGGWTMCYFFNKYIKNTNSSVRSFQQLVNKGGYIQALGPYAGCCNDSLAKFNTYEATHKKFADYVESKMDKYDVDVLVYPTTKNVITKVSNASIKSPSSTISPPTGYPAISIPMGFKNGLPYGIEFVAKYNEEHLLYAITEALENKDEVKISELTPDLYEISDEVETLVDFYKENLETLNTKRYKEVKEDMLDFFDEYNAIENKEETATALIGKYNTVTETILLEQAKKEQMIKMTKGVGIGVGVLFTLLVIVSAIKKKKRKKRRKYSRRVGK